jgi:hypothetical protein
MTLDVDKCPLCSREVEAVHFVRHCNDPVIVSLVYQHDGEKHFLFLEPREANGLSLTRVEELSPT